MKWIKSIPNIITLSNAFLGMLAILFIIESSDRVEISNHLKQTFEITAKPNHFMYLGIASYLIILAALFDFLDGFLAKLLKAQSKIGAQLDSLADVITFGVAPSMIMYKLMEQALAINANGFGQNTIKLWPALLIGIASCYRLAKFNSQTKQINYFKGIPTPASALFIISIPFIIISSDKQITRIFLDYNFLLGLTLLVSYLLISNIPMFSFKTNNWKIKDNIYRYTLMIVAFISILIFGYLGAIIIFASYIILSLVFKNKIIAE